jgi:hypothetical protein
MPNLTNWIEIEILTYYAQIVSAFLFLILCETVRERDGAWMDYYFGRDYGRSKPEKDYIE